ncbi:hypothetical protein MNBD_CHLOROFLEXI01-451 [hydrothermal vent metagenome]|uniref:Polymer-forming cytoskeletal protein n=1 Tax=hydrothermal vent metagenome TaxID=652676 RepID=A0A3B0USB2_9ZZZZ
MLLLAIPSGAVLAAPIADKVVNADDVIRNDIILFNEDFELADGGRVTGDIIIFNGNAHIAGTVNGDVVLFNGNLTTEATASLNGDCVLLNGQSSGEDGSAVSCTNLDVVVPDGVVNFVDELASSNEFTAEFTAEPSVEVQRLSPLVRFAGGTAAAVARSLLFGLLAFAAASLLPQQMLRIEETLRTKPVASGAVGLLTASSMLFVIPILLLISTVLILVCIGLLGFPLIFVMVLGLVAAGFVGWFTMGNVVGEFLARRMNWKGRSQAATTALGTVVITFVIGFLGAVPFVFGESLITWAIIFLGLGATMLTKFGTRAYPIVALPTVNDDKVTAVLDTLYEDTLPNEPDSSD